MKKPSEHVWTTREGKEIPVAEMTEKHLLNAYRFLQREVRSYREAFSAYFDPIWGPQGEMAQLAAEQEIDTYPERLAILNAWLLILGEEITRRELDCPPDMPTRPLPKMELVEEYKGARIYKKKEMISPD